MRKLCRYKGAIYHALLEKGWQVEYVYDGQHRQQWASMVKLPDLHTVQTEIIHASLTQ